MKDSYGTEIREGCQVTFNYSGHLAFGIVKETKETWHYGSKSKGKEILVEYQAPTQQHSGFKTALESRPKGALVKCNQVLVIQSPMEELGIEGTYNDIRRDNHPALTTPCTHQPRKEGTIIICDKCGMGLGL